MEPVNRPRDDLAAVLGRISLLTQQAGMPAVDPVEASEIPMLTDVYVGSTVQVKPESMQQQALSMPGAATTASYEALLDEVLPLIRSTINKVLTESLDQLIPDLQNKLTQELAEQVRLKLISLTVSKSE
ncbi:hypothetical protein [Methylovorus mays]|uniref:hypothetical protein n=1 Tax=Methylovorus mays TaxID=184077 RepID=UPI001E3FD723|nr:hypothetical protein [Methylovorus mays]MCB5207227.1 hypothetical protein [Methylovorus mays]